MNTYLVKELGYGFGGGREKTYVMARTAIEAVQHRESVYVEYRNGECNEIVPGYYKRYYHNNVFCSVRFLGPAEEVE